MRKLGKLPKRRCWFIGFSNMDGMDMAYKFNEHWQTDLRIGENDCRNYTNGNAFLFLRSCLNIILHFLLFVCGVHLYGLPGCDQSFREDLISFSTLLP